MADIRERFEQFLHKHPHPRYESLQREGYAYTDEFINYALHCFNLITVQDKDSAPVRAYTQWKNSNYPDEGKNPMLFYAYVEDLMADDVTHILKFKWVEDRNKAIDHLTKCRMVILSGKAAAALYDD